MKTKTQIQKKANSFIMYSLLVLLNLYVSNSFAQEAQMDKSNSRPRLTVLNVDTKGLDMDPVQMGNMVRLEVEKLDKFQVMDQYDVSYIIGKKEINISNCYGKICLVEVGKVINSDKMLTGSVQLLGENIIITLRVIDVKSESIEKTQVTEFLNLPKDLQAMVKISVRQMFGLTNEEPVVTYLTKKNNYESSTNNPQAPTVNLSGPRSGFVYFTGQNAKIMQAAKSEGGFNSYPIMFQFGYQFEKQYLNEGDYQALVEFLPMISGFNQNIFIPSFTLLNGFRNNKMGWEIAFGPTFGFVKKADGYYDAENVWHLEGEWQDTTYTNPNPFKITKRLDSRGIPELQAGFIVAFGKTFKSGKLNIPVNFYIAPNKEGLRVGASFGFNAKRK